MRSGIDLQLFDHQISAQQIIPYRRWHVSLDLIFLLRHHGLNDVLF